MWSWRFDPGDATGTPTEVGVGWLEYPPPNYDEEHRCFSRALIVDGAGNPVSITVLADEYLDVTYAMRLYPYMGADSVKSVTLSGSSYTFTTRAVDVAGSWRFSLPGYPTTFEGFGFNVYTGTDALTPPALNDVEEWTLDEPGLSDLIMCTPDPYTVNKKISGVLSAGLPDCNMDYGIRGLAYHGSGSSFLQFAFQTTISPAIPKDNTKVLSFGTSITWDRK